MKLNKIKVLTLILGLALLSLANGNIRADGPFPGCTLQNTADDRSEGRFIFKNRGNHFPGNAVILAPRCYYVASRRTSPITVDIYNADGSVRIERAKLKSTGYCPGNLECLAASTFLASRNGGYFKRNYSSILVKIKPTATGPRCGCSYYEIANPAARAAFRAPVVERR